MTVRSALRATDDVPLLNLVETLKERDRDEDDDSLFALANLELHTDTRQRSARTWRYFPSLCFNDLLYSTAVHLLS